MIQYIQVYGFQELKVMDLTNAGSGPSWIKDFDRELSLLGFLPKNFCSSLENDWKISSHKTEKVCYKINQVTLEGLNEIWKKRDDYFFNNEEYEKIKREAHEIASVNFPSKKGKRNDKKKEMLKFMDLRMNQPKRKNKNITEP